MRTPIPRRRVLIGIPMLALRAACGRGESPVTVNARDFANLQTAINQAPAGATILGNADAAYPAMTLSVTRPVTIERATFAGRLTLKQPQAVQLLDCTFSEGSGLELAGAIDGRVSKCRFTKAGVVVRNSPGMHIAQNTFQESDIGINLIDSPATVVDNSFNSDDAGTAITVTATRDAVGATEVTRNTITQAQTGVLLQSTVAGALNNVTVGVNTLTNCAVVSIKAEGTAGAHVALVDNTIGFTRPATRARIGITTAGGIALERNTITYTRESVGSAEDMPIYLVGNDVTMSDNTIDGGGRDMANNLIPASSVAPPRTYTGWEFRRNHFENGARIDKRSIVADVEQDNVVATKQNDMLILPGGP